MVWRWTLQISPGPTAVLSCSLGRDRFLLWIEEALMEQCMSDCHRIGCSAPQMVLDPVSLGRFDPGALRQMALASRQVDISLNISAIL